MVKAMTPSPHHSRKRPITSSRHPQGGGLFGCLGLIDVVVWHDSNFILIPCQILKHAMLKLLRLHHKGAGPFHPLPVEKRTDAYEPGSWGRGPR